MANRQCGIPTVCLCLCLAALELAAAGLAGEPDPPPVGLVDYARIVTLYRSGSPRDAVSRIRGWSDRAIEQTLVRVMSHGAWVLSPEDVEQAAWGRAADAATLLHASAALAAAFEGRREEHDRHLLFSTSLFEWQHEGPGRPTAPSRIESREFYAAIAAAELAVGNPARASATASLGLRLDPADPVLFLVAATAQEELAGLHRQHRHRSDERAALQQAEHGLRQALVAGAGLEARLRLGRVLSLQGRHWEAESPLARVVEEATGPRERYLALLFLAEAHERRGRAGAAADAYRRALDVHPHAQAARLGLARVLERSEGPAAGTVLVRECLAASRRADRSPDPWWSYRLGDLGLRPLAELEQRLASVR